MFRSSIEDRIQSEIKWFSIVSKEFLDAIFVVQRLSLFKPRLSQIICHADSDIYSVSVEQIATDFRHVIRQ